MLRNKDDFHDVDPAETADWLDSLAAVARDGGAARAEFLLSKLGEWAQRHRVRLPWSANTPYCNTTHRTRQPRFPGDCRRARPPQLAELVSPPVSVPLPDLSVRARMRPTAEVRRLDGLSQLDGPRREFADDVRRDRTVLR